MNAIDWSRNQIIVAMDHARYFGMVKGLEDPGAVIDRVVDAGADGIMTSFGVIKHYRERLTGRIPTLMRLDGGASFYRDPWRGAPEWSLLHTVEEARALGAQGVCVMLFIGAEVELETIEITTQVVRECAADGMTVMVEALACPHPNIPHPDTTAPMANACRIAFEHGADVVKTYYTGSVEAFRPVAASCPVPVLIAGGVRMDSDAEAYEVVHGAIAAGGNGVVFGRNIWQSADPAAFVKGLRHIIHDGGTAAEATSLAAAA